MVIDLTRSTADPWFGGAAPAPDAEVILFCLPYAGGGAAAYRLWSPSLPRRISVQPLRLPGREQRIGEPAVVDVPAVADALTRRADRPYAIYGHSMGARLGFEAVRELRRRGEPLPLRLYAGGARPPDDGIASVLDHTRPDAELVRHLERIGGVPAGLFDSAELRDLLLPVIRADLTWVAETPHVAGSPLPIPVVTVAGAHDRVAPADAVTGWARHTVAGHFAHVLDGGHFFLHDARRALLDLLAVDLRRPAAIPC